MKAIAIVFAISVGLSFAASAQTRDPPAPAPGAPTPAKKKPEAAKEGTYCKWKGGDFSAGAEFCVFQGRAMLCENGVWKREDMAVCIVTPAVLP